MPQQPPSPLDQYRAYVADVYESASRYTTGVVATGYAVFFTVWAFTRQYLPPRAALWAGLLMILSAFSFVTWEVFGVIREALTFIGAKRAGASQSTLVQQAQDRARQRKLRKFDILSYWWISVVLAVVPAFVAFIILVVNLVRALVWGSL